MKADWVEALGTWGSSIVALYIALNGYNREKASRQRQEQNWERRRDEEVGEQRRNDSILGVAVIGPLLEEVRSGHAIMVRVLHHLRGRAEAAAELIRIVHSSQSNQGNTGVQTKDEVSAISHGHWQQLLPSVSWEGMSTIPDEVLLRIIATDTGQQADEFPVRDIRLHCKNYFSHICENVNARLRNLSSGHASFADEEELRLFLDSGDGTGDYINATRKVITMLEVARDRLEKNAALKCPK